MRSISPNTELATSVRLFIGLTGASILRHFRCVYSSLWLPSGLVRDVGFAKLKNLSNQEKLSIEPQSSTPFRWASFSGT
jgi:hypothetical protein